MSFKPNDIERLLLHKFQFNNPTNRSDDHIWFELKLDDLPTVTTKVSRNKKEIGKNLKGKIAKQLHVKVRFLEEMFSCTKSKEQYEALLRTDPYPPFE